MLDIAEYNEDFFRETGGFDDNLPEWIEEPQNYAPKTFTQWRKANGIKKAFVRVLKSGHLVKVTQK